jgi:hypothetical protein
VKTKIELVNGAFAELRISGLTSATDAEDIELGLSALERIMYSAKLPLPYNFEDIPDPNTESGLPEHAVLAIELKLAQRLAPSYNKPSNIPGLSYEWSQLISRLKQPRYLQPSPYAAWSWQFWPIRPNQLHANAGFVAARHH